MLKTFVTIALVAVAIAGCSTTKVPTTPKEAYLNRAAGAEVAASNCASSGGYSSVAQMRADQQINLSEARKLGATDAEYGAARTRVQNQWNTTYIFMNAYVACNQLINSVAWAGTAKPILPPAPDATTKK
nr:hypothetical protein [uncultured Devosia sp.]